MELIVYHGSNIVVEHPDADHSGVYGQDFGTGFYITTDLETAQEYALDRAQTRGGIPIITSYFLDFEELDKWGCVYLGNEPNHEWFEVVRHFRQNNQPLERYKNYNAYAGLVANYRSAEVFEMYFDGELSEQEALNLLFKIILQPQICLKNNEIIDDVLAYIPDDDLEQGVW